MATNTSYEVSSQELRACAQELLTLKAEYDGLFGKTSSILSILNGNWSSFLANNFDGKINSAQNVCKNVAQMLEIGGKLALDNAENYEKLEEELFKNQIASNLGGFSIFSKGAIEGIPSEYIAGATLVSSGIDFKSLVLGLPSEAKDFFRNGWEFVKKDVIDSFTNAQKGVKYFKDLADKYIPSKVQKEISKQVYSAIEKFGNKDLSVAAKATEQLLKGQYLDSAETLFNRVTDMNILSSGVKNMLQNTFDPAHMDSINRTEKEIATNFKNGNIIGGLANMAALYHQSFTVPAFTTAAQIANDVPGGKQLASVLSVFGLDMSDEGLKKGLVDAGDDIAETLGKFATVKGKEIQNAATNAIKSIVVDHKDDIVNLARETNKGINYGVKALGLDKLGGVKSLVATVIKRK